jgi:hypothetical protein
MFSEAGVTPSELNSETAGRLKLVWLRILNASTKMKLQKIWSGNLLGQQHQGNIASGDRLIARIARVHRD